MQAEELRRAAAQIRMIVLDLDGTTMDGRHIVTPRTRSVIRRLLDRGYLVVPASGRGFDNVRNDVFPELEFPYMIAANGSSVVEWQTGRHLLERLIPYRTAADMVLDLLDDEENCLYVQFNDGLDTHRDACHSEEAFRRHCMFPGMPPRTRYTAAQLRELVLAEGKDIPKIGLWFQRADGFERYEAIAAQRYPQVRAFRVSENSLEFCSAGTSKAAALKWLCGRLGVPPEQVCAIGDNGNDVDMLRFAGLGVAVENAIEPTKQAAAHIAGRSDQEGAACFLETYFCNDPPSPESAEKGISL